MSPSLLAFLSLIVLLLGIMYVRIPIAFLLAFLGVGGYALLDGMSLALNMAGNELWGTFSNYGLTVIPFFIFMGQICFQSGLSERLYAGMQAWCGHRRGGLCFATLAACGGFAAICGSNTATAATMSVVALPEMRRYAYNDILSTGTVVAGTTLGAIIPPSVVAIVVGVQTAQSIEGLFLGGLVPGLVLLALFMFTVALVVKRKSHWAPVAPRKTWSQRLASLGGLAEGFLLFTLVVMGLAVGVFTPTEAGAVGSFSALLVGLVRKTLTWKSFVKALEESLSISAMLLFLLAGAAMYGKFLTLTRLPFELATTLTGLHLPEPLIFGIVLLIFVLGGMVMDALALLVIALPIFFPLAQALQWDPLWFSMVLMVVTSLGAMTPPVGIAAYIVSNLSAKEESRRVPLQEVFKGALLFLPAYVLCLVLMLIFPDIVVFLPQFLR